MQWLSDNVKGKNAIKDAKTFLNIHLRCEHCCRLQEAGEYPDIPPINVGQSMAVKQTVKAINSRAAKEAMDNCFDIQADL